MDDTERYRFDLNGYLALPGALEPAAVERLNALMDERIAGDVPADAHTYRFGNVLDWGPEVRALIDHEPILPYLEEILGRGFRLDHDYVDLIRHGKGPIGTKLHGGAAPYDPGQSYAFIEGRPRSLARPERAPARDPRIPERPVPRTPDRLTRICHLILSRSLVRAVCDIGPPPRDPGQDHRAGTDLRHFEYADDLRARWALRSAPRSHTVDPDPPTP